MSQSAGSSNRDALISSASLRKALRALEPSLGRTTIEELFYDLEDYGISISHSKMSYPLSLIEDALRKLFGEDAASLMVERLEKMVHL